MDEIDYGTLEVTVLGAKTEKISWKLEDEDMWTRAYAVCEPYVETHRRKTPLKGSLTLMEKPANFDEALDMARAMMGEAKDATRTDRDRYGRNTLGRAEKREDNRRHGGWNYGRD